MAFMQHSTGGFRGMLVFSKEVRGHRATSGLLGLALFGVLISVGSGLTPVVSDASDLGVLPSLGGGFVGGVFVGGAAFASFVNWRRHSGTWAGWRLATGAGPGLEAFLLFLHDDRKLVRSQQQQLADDTEYSQYYLYDTYRRNQKTCSLLFG